VGLDLKPGSTQTLKTAIELASETGAAVTAVHALADGVIVPGMGDTQLQEMLIEAARAELCSIQKDAGSVVETVIEIGRPAALIHTVALHQRADLVVIGRESDRTILGRIRANANAVIHEAPCPVLSL